jgi:hypothetical protein
MSNYTKSTNFATKDTLPTGDSGKIVKGTEIDSEFNAISSAISSKADTASPTFTGTPAAPTAASGSNTTQIATTAFVTGALTSNASATETLTNKTISADSNTLSGIAASSFVMSNASGNIDGSASQKAIPSGVVVGTTDSQTLTNKTLALGSNTVLGTKSEFNTAVTDTDFAFVNDFTGSNVSLTANGYQKFPSGLIMQWCESGSASSETQVSVTFPIAFPNAVLRTIVGTKTGGGNSDLIAQLQSESTTGCVINFNSLGSPQSVTAYVFAIGY